MRRYLFFALLSLCFSLSAPAAHAVVTFDELGRLLDAQAAYAEQNPHLKDKGPVPEPDRYDDFGNTRLYNAVKAGDAVLAARLLAEGANPDVVTASDNTALGAAVKKGNLELARLLLEKGADPNLKAVISLAGSQPMRDLLVAHGADPAKKPPRKIMLSFFNPEHSRLINAKLEEIRGGKPLDSLVIAVILDTDPQDMPGVLQKAKERGQDANERDPVFGTALHQVMEQGRSAALAGFLLQNGANPNLAWRDTRPLSEAVAGNRTDVAELLLKAGADMGAKDATGRTILFQALERGARLDMLKLLVDSGADPLARDGKGRTALIYAMGRKDRAESVPYFLDLGVPVQECPGERPLLTKLELSRETDRALAVLLLEKGLRPGTDGRADPSLLHMAVSHGDTRLFEAALKAGADINERTEYGSTVLLRAVEEDRPDMARMALAAGAPVNGSAVLPGTIHTDYTGRLRKGTDDLLARAVDKGNPEMARMLIKAGADLNSPRNTYGRPRPLHVAVEKKRTELVSLLLESGADPSLPDGEGRTPLVLALEEKDNELALVLLKAGADPNVCSRRGDRALTLAAEAGSGPLVTELIRHKAEVNPKIRRMERYSLPRPSEESTPLYEAARRGHRGVAAILLRYGADPNNPEQDGATALFAAARGADPELVRLLLAHKADPGVTDMLGNTPLHLAAYSSAPQNSELLLKAGADVNAGRDRGDTPLDNVRDMNGPVAAALRKAGGKTSKELGADAGKRSLEKNREADIPELTARAVGGDVKAQVALGRKYSAYARGGERADPAKAAAWLRKAAEAGDPEGALLLALELEAMVLMALEEKARQESGNPEEPGIPAGLYYGEGGGHEEMPAEALKWMEFAAERGYAPAARQLSKAYGRSAVKELQERAKDAPAHREDAFDWNPAPSAAKALYWLKRCAASGERECTRELALMYEEARNVDKPVPVPPDFQLAWVWRSISLQGMEGYEAEDWREELEVRARALTPKERDRLRAIVAAWPQTFPPDGEYPSPVSVERQLSRLEFSPEQLESVQEAAAKGDLHANLQLALYYSGRSDDNEREKAPAFAHKAAQGGSPLAMMYLAGRYRDKGMRKEAAQWMEKAAETGYGPAVPEMLGIAESSRNPRLLGKWTMVLALRGTAMQQFRARYLLLQFMGAGDPTGKDPVGKGMEEGEAWHQSHPLTYAQ